MTMQDLKLAVDRLHVVVDTRLRPSPVRLDTLTAIDDLLAVIDAELRSMGEAVS